MLNRSVQREEDKLERCMMPCFSRDYVLVDQGILWSKMQRKKLVSSLSYWVKSRFLLARVPPSPVLCILPKAVRIPEHLQDRVSSPWEEGSIRVPKWLKEEIVNVAKIEVLLNMPRNGDLRGQSSALRSCLSVHFKMFHVRPRIHRDFSILSLTPSKALKHLCILNIGASVFSLADR